MGRTKKQRRQGGVEMKKSIKWHGHANFQINTRWGNILIDPWFEENPSCKIKPSECGDISMVLVTHDHFDHVGETVEICKNTGAKLFAIVETALKLKDMGINDDQIVNGIGFNIGGTVEENGIKFTMVEAHHSSASGVPVGYIITFPDSFTIYHAGDTSIFASMQTYGELYNIDIAMLPIGGVFTMDPRQAAYACKLLKCKSIIPMHWGSFPVLEQNTENLIKEIKALKLDTKVISLNPGEEIEVE